MLTHFRSLSGGSIVSNVDTTPDAFAFTDQTGVALSTVTSSNTITVTGINASTTISITGGEYRINAGSWVSSSGSVVNNDTVQVRHTSSGSNSTATNTVLTIGGVSDTFTTTTVAASGDFQLASGHWVPRKSDMVIEHPRPDGETNSYAQHRNAYTGLAWSTRVVVRDGAWPFKYELDATSLGKGITIGAQLTAVGDVLEPSATYSVISWANPTAGSHTITVTVYDQDYGRGGSPSSAATVSFTLVVGTANHVFIDPVSGSDSNAGTLAAPFQTINKLHSGSSSTTTYNGKVVWLRSGTHDLDGMSTNGNNYRINSGCAPCVFVGYPGETAVLNSYQGWFVLGDGAGDFMLKDLTIQHASEWTTLQRFVFLFSATHRHSYHNVTFQNYYVGSAPASDNPSHIFYANSGTAVQHITMAGCVMTGQIGNVFETYCVDGVCIELNRVIDATTSGQLDTSNDHNLFYLKDSTLNVTFRANEVYDGNSLGTAGIVGVGGQNDGALSHAYNNIQICYNKLDSGNSTVHHNIEYAGTGGTLYTFRNSCGAHILEGGYNTPSVDLYEYNAVTDGYTSMVAVSSVQNALTNASLFDASLNLTGSYRTTYLGTHGAEIA